MSALYLDLGLKAPAGWAFGTQLFKDHIRPVLYNVSTQKTYDLVGGGIGPFRAAIMKPNALFRGLFNGAGSARTSEDSQLLSQFGVEFIYRDWECILRPGFELRHPLQSATFAGMSGCKAFQPGGGQNPKHASNDSKASDVSHEETATSEKLDKQQNEQKEEPQDDDEFDASGSRGGGVAGLLGLFRPPRHNLPDYLIEGLKKAAANAIPAEQEMILRALAKKAYTRDLLEIASDSSLVRSLGYGHLLNRAQYSFELMNMVVVEYVPNPVAGQQTYPLSSTRENDTLISYKESGLVKIQSSDETLVKNLRSQSLRQRTRTVLDIIIRESIAPVNELSRANLPLATAQDTLSAIDRNPSLRQSISQLAKASHDFTDLLLMGIRQVKAADELNSPVVVAVNQIYITETQLIRFSPTLKTCADQILDDVVAVLRWLSVNGDRLNGALNTGGFLTNLGKIQAVLRDSGIDPAYARSPRYAQSQNTLTDFLLFNVLSHEQFYFTVKIDKSERLAQRPFYPLEILDPRVIEMQHRSEIHTSIPVNLPTWPGLSCAPGQKGYYGSGVAIECGSGAAADQDNVYDQGTLNRSGAVHGATTGVSRDQASGQATSARAGLIRDSTRGIDRQPGLKLRKALTAAEAKVSPTAAARNIRVAGATNGNLDLIDPRQEIDLPPVVWRALLESADRQFLNENVVRVLNHHTFRKRLTSVYESPELASNLRVIDYMNLERPDFVLPLDYYENKSGRLEIEPERANARAMAMNLIATFDMYQGLGDKPFFQVALAEIEVGKAGFKYLRRDVVLHSGTEAAAAIGLINSREIGGRIPELVQVQGQYLELLTNSQSDTAYLKYFPTSSPSADLSIQGSWRRALTSEDHTLGGFMTHTGDMFGKSYISYYLRSGTGLTTTVDRIDRAISDLRSVSIFEFKPLQGLSSNAG